MRTPERVRPHSFDGPRPSIELRPRAPFRLDLTAWALRRRRTNRVDRWDGSTYRRALHVGDRVVAVAVDSIGDVDRPTLGVSTSDDAPLSDVERRSLSEQLTTMLGLDVDLRLFYALTDGDGRFDAVVHQFRGVKPPRFPTLFEALVNAIANQQLSLEVGIELLNRITDRFGERSRDDRGGIAFPRPEAVLAGSVADLRRMGFSNRKAEYILGCADAIVTGELDEARLSSMDRPTQMAELSALRGIGRWSAEYVSLRGLGRTDVYPADDVGARNKLQRFFDLPSPPDRDEILALVERWHPYAGLVYFHLLLHGLMERGDVDA